MLPLLWVWFAVGLCLAPIGPRERPWYLALALPPLMMLSGHSVSLLLRSGRGESGPRPAHHLVIGALWAVYMLADPLVGQMEMGARQYYYAFVAPPDEPTLATVSAIQSHAGADEAIFCFDYRPDVCWLADRPPAIRYLGTVSAGGWGDATNPLRDQIAELVRAAAPKVIVYGAGADAHPHAREFENWLRSRYEQVDQVELAHVWVRRD